jgi:hypothetical protein
MSKYVARVVDSDAESGRARNSVGWAKRDWHFPFR